MSGATLTIPGGGTPERYVLGVKEALQVTQGDALYAAQRQRTRILERTLKGVDVDGAPFAPYSTAGPYYWYPNGKVGRTRAAVKSAKAAVTRLINRIGTIESHTGREIGGERTRNGQGIKFASYAAFKASLGRLGVDLMGPRAPHMLQALAVGVSFERIIGDETAIGLRDRPEPAQDITIGIYGDEGLRASAHNKGVPGRLPRRHFLGASAADQEGMVQDMTGRIVARVKLAETLKS